MSPQVSLIYLHFNCYFTCRHHSRVFSTFWVCNSSWINNWRWKSWAFSLNSEVGSNCFSLERWEHSYLFGVHSRSCGDMARTIGLHELMPFRVFANAVQDELRPAGWVHWPEWGFVGKVPYHLFVSVIRQCRLEAVLTMALLNAWCQLPVISAHKCVFNCKTVKIHKFTEFNLSGNIQIKVAEWLYLGVISLVWLFVSIEVVSGHQLFGVDTVQRIKSI